MADSDPKPTRAPPPQDGPVVIKKYANRRLYNTRTSAYVTLEDLAAMVRSGADFVVYDARTGEDLTRQILTQIIFEEESRGQALLPVQFLRQLIGFYGGQMQSVLPGYLELSLETFARQQDEMREQMAKVLSTPPGAPLTPGVAAGQAAETAQSAAHSAAQSAVQGAALVQEAVRRNMAMFGQALQMFPGFTPAAAPARVKDKPAASSPPSSPPLQSASEAPPAADALAEMRRQMDEMRAQIDRIAGERKP